MNAEQPRPKYLGTVADPSSLDVDVLFIPAWTDSDPLNDVPWLHDATGGEVRRAREAGEYRVIGVVLAFVAGNTYLTLPVVPNRNPQHSRGACRCACAAIAVRTAAGSRRGRIIGEAQADRGTGPAPPDSPAPQDS